MTSNADDGRTAAPKRARRRNGPGVRLAPGPMAYFQRDVPPDPFTVEMREKAALYPFSTTFMPPRETELQNNSCELSRGIRSPEYECKHDRLPGDRTAPCGCWPGEAAAGAGNGGPGASGLPANPLPLSHGRAA